MGSLRGRGRRGLPTLALLAIVFLRLHVCVAFVANNLTVDVENGRDISQPGGSCTACLGDWLCKSLRCAVAIASSQGASTILLRPGIYTGPHNAAITLQFKSVSIHGVSGRAEDVLFQLDPESHERFNPLFVFQTPTINRNTSLAHVTIDGAWQSAVWVMGGATPSFENIVIRNSRVRAAMEFQDFGTQVTLRAVQFFSNGDSASDSVLKVYNGAQAFLDNVEFRGNNAQRCVLVSSGSGVVQLQPIMFHMRNSNIQYNTQNGIELQGGSRPLSALVEDSHIDHNGQHSSDDAFRVSSTVIAPNVTLYRVSINYNSVDSAALNVVPQVAANLVLVNCSVDGNTGGAGIAKTGQGNTVIIGTTVRLNDNTVGAGRERGQGGGLHLAGTAFLYNVMVSENTALVGGGMYAGPHNYDITLDGCTFKDNEVLETGSALYSACDKGRRCSLSGRRIVLANNLVTGADSEDDKPALVSVQSGASVDLRTNEVTCDNAPLLLHCSESANTSLTFNGNDGCNSKAAHCSQHVWLFVGPCLVFMFMCVIALWCRRLDHADKQAQREADKVSHESSYDPLLVRALVENSLKKTHPGQPVYMSSNASPSSSPSPDKPNISHVIPHATSSHARVTQSSHTYTRSTRTTNYGSFARTSDQS